MPYGIHPSNQVSAMHATYRQLLFATQLATLCLGLCAATEAGNNSFVSDAPIGKFTEEDMTMMNVNLDATVADEKVRIVHSWNNPNTTHSGTAETLVTFAGPKGITCKRVSITNRASSLAGKGQYTLCKMPEQGWTFVPNEYAPMPKTTGK
jgi:hypothetical protein